MRKSVVGFLVLACLMVFAPKADAALILAGDIAGLPGFCATDNNVICTYGIQLPDNDPTVGTLDIGTATVGGVTVNGSIHTSLFGPPTNLLDSTSLSIINPLGGAGTVVVDASISATGFPGPTTFAQATGSGTWGLDSQGSSTTYTYYIDAANGQGGETGTDRPGTQFYTASDTANSAIDSYSFNSGALPFVFGGPFSMTLGFQLSLLDGDSLISRGQSAITDVAVTEVPEPMSMLLLGSGLLGIGGLRRRQQKKQKQKKA